MPDKVVVKGNIKARTGIRNINLFADILRRNGIFLSLYNQAV